MRSEIVIFEEGFFQLSAERACGIGEETWQVIELFAEDALALALALALE